jgi:hypothetical protein
MTKVWLLLTMAGVGFAQICLVEPAAGKPITPTGCTDTVHVCTCSGSVWQWQWACMKGQQTTTNRNTSMSMPFLVRP